MIAGLILTLAGCGGASRFQNDGARTTASPTYIPRAAPRATGPINSACMSSDRKARSQTLCGCIQAVADQTLSGAQQYRAVQFYGNPHLAQEVRQSDNSRDEQFWDAYVEYGKRANATCS